MAPKIISNYNFKGGVGKTSTTFMLGWMQASKDPSQKILLVDSDPQCNLTQVFLRDPDVVNGVRPEHVSIFEDIDDTFDANTLNITIGHSLLKNVRAVSDSSRARPVTAIPHRLKNNLFLCPGSISISEYEEALYSAITSRQLLQCPTIGLFYNVVLRTAEEIGADFVIIDCSPSLGLMNQSIVMSSDYFLTACQADFFSRKAIQSLSHRIVEWRRKYLRDFRGPSRANGVNPLPYHTTMFLGAVVQFFTVHNGLPSLPHQMQINSLHVALSAFGEILIRLRMALPATDGIYARLNVNGVNPYVLCKAQNFNKYAAMSQEAGLPLIGLLENKGYIRAEGKAYTGRILENALEFIDRVTKDFNNVLDVVEKFPSERIQGTV